MEKKSKLKTIKIMKANETFISLKEIRENYKNA